MTIPATISSTTAGRRRLGANPRVSGAAKATAVTIRRFVKWTSSTGALSRAAGGRYARRAPTSASTSSQ